MTSPQQQPGTGWSVQGTRQVVAPNAAGVLTQMTEIQFTTGAGEPGAVRVPEAGLTVDVARAAVAAQALKMDQIRALKG